MTVRPEARDPQSAVADAERDLRRLDAELRQLEIACSLFFAGRRSRPPLDLRSGVEATFKRWVRAINESVEYFRFTILQMRFRSLANLWDSALREREEGRPGPFSRTS